MTPPKDKQLQCSKQLRCCRSKHIKVKAPKTGANKYKLHLKILQWLQAQIFPRNRTWNCQVCELEGEKLSAYYMGGNNIWGKGTCQFTQLHTVTVWGQCRLWCVGTMWRDRFCLFVEHVFDITGQQTLQRSFFLFSNINFKIWTTIFSAKKVVLMKHQCTLIFHQITLSITSAQDTCSWNTG